jgi:hypothetical protein
VVVVADLVFQVKPEVQVVVAAVQSLQLLWADLVQRAKEITAGL